MRRVLETWDASHDGQLQITDTSWELDGTLKVTVRELMGPAAWPKGIPLVRMRSLAKRCMPDHSDGKVYVRTVATFAAEGFEYVIFELSVQPVDGTI